MAMQLIGEDQDNWTIADDVNGQTATVPKSRFGGVLPIGVTRTSAEPPVTDPTVVPRQAAPEVDTSALGSSYVPGTSAAPYRSPSLVSTQTGLDMPPNPDAVSGADPSQPSWPPNGRPNESAAPPAVFGQGELTPTGGQSPEDQVAQASQLAPTPPGTATGGSKTTSGSSSRTPGVIPYQRTPEVKGFPTDAELMKARKGAQDKYAETERDALLNEAEGKKSAADLYADAAAHETEQAPFDQLREKGRQAIEEEKFLNFENAVSDYDSYKVDPDRWFKSRTTAQNVMKWTSVALSGLANTSLMVAQVRAGGTPTKHSNSALDEIDKEINRDIDLQKLEQEKLGSSVGMAKSLYDMTHQRMGDQREADAAAKALAWKGVERLANIKLMQSGAEADKARAQNVVNAAHDKYLGYVEQMKQVQRDNADREMGRRIQWAGLAETKRHNQVEESKAPKGASLADTLAMRKLEIRNRNGKLIAYASTDTDAAIANDIIKGEASLGGILARGKELFGPNGGYAANGTEQRRRQDAWVKDYIAANKLIGGDRSAVQNADITYYGLDPSDFNNFAKLEEREKSRRPTSAARLRQTSNDITTERLIELGIVDPEDTEEGRSVDQRPAASTSALKKAQSISEQGGIGVYDNATGEVLFKPKNDAGQLIQTFGERYSVASPKQLKEYGARKEAEKKKVEQDNPAATLMRQRAKEQGVDVSNWESAK